MASRGRNPRLTAYRKLMKQGNSLVIAPPPPFLKALGVLKGDIVLIEHVPGSDTFQVRAVGRQARGRGIPVPVQLPLEPTR